MMPYDFSEQYMRVRGALLVYLITRRETGQKYIGIVHGKTQSVWQRWQEHCKPRSNGAAWYFRLEREIRECGPAAFSVQVIDIASTRKELGIKERHYIRHFDTINKGYNASFGGAPEPEMHSAIMRRVMAKRMRRKSTRRLLSKKGKESWLSNHDVRAKSLNDAANERNGTTGTASQKVEQRHIERFLARALSFHCIFTKPLQTEFLGKRFGRIVVIDVARKAGYVGGIRIVAKCDCGTIFDVEKNDLRHPRNRVSCGCGPRGGILKQMLAKSKRLCYTGLERRKPMSEPSAISLAARALAKAERKLAKTVEKAEEFVAKAAKKAEAKVQAKIEAAKKAVIDAKANVVTLVK